MWIKTGHSTVQLPDPPQQVDHLGPELGVEPEVDERVWRRVIVLVYSVLSFITNTDTGLGQHGRDSCH